MAHRWNSSEAAAARRARGARATHRVIVEQGRKIASEANDARRTAARRRRLIRALDAAPVHDSGPLLCPHSQGPTLTDSGEQER